jgi:hypothetical protein
MDARNQPGSQRPRRRRIATGITGKQSGLTCRISHSRRIGIIGVMGHRRRISIISQSRRIGIIFYSRRISHSHPISRISHSHPISLTSQIRITGHSRRIRPTGHSNPISHIRPTGHGRRTGVTHARRFHVIYRVIFRVGLCIQGHHHPAIGAGMPRPF